MKKISGLRMSSAMEEKLEWLIANMIYGADKVRWRLKIPHQ